MDQENLQLQRMLHEQNSQRMSKMEDEQLRQGRLLAEILSNTSSLPTLLERVDNLESSRDKERGITGLILFAWGGIEAFFRFHR